MELSIQNAFLSLVIFTSFQRIFELFLAKSNEKFILSEGGKVLPEKNYLFMVILHTTWLLAILYFALTQTTSVSPALFWISLVFFLLGQTLRIVAISTLGRRWSTRVVVLPKAPVVKKGVFNFIRHPNYLGVILEIFALPLMGGLYEIAIFFSLMNFIILHFRIKFEEKMLCTHNNYSEEFGIKA